MTEPRAIAADFVTFRDHGRRAVRPWTREQFKVRILKFVRKEASGCWVWTAATRAYRYGVMSVGTQMYMAAHRAAYLVWRGHIDGNLSVCHTCDNGLCVNPDHLFLGTHKENMDDRDRKGRGNQPSGARHAAALHPELFKRLGSQLGKNANRKGVANGRAKLTVVDVQYIRQSNVGPSFLGSCFGVDRHTISAIRSRKLWAHVP